MASCNSNKTVQSVPAKNKVLVVVDVQRDFFDPSGSLYVSGSETLPDAIAAVADRYDAVIFTLDWHPADHCSFASNGGIWPSHCVAYTQGAGLPDLFSPVMARGSADVQLYLKGCDSTKEQYGAFEDFENNPVAAAWLKNCDSVDICGIAGDYCVKETAANILKFVPSSKVTILTALTRSIDGGSTLDAFITEKGINRE